MSTAATDKAPGISVRRRLLNRLLPSSKLSNLRFDPLDPKPGEDAARALFRMRAKESRFGSIERGRFILRIIERCAPTPYLSQAYFANLEAILSQKKPIPRPGAVVIGLGSGRSGSTTLTKLFQSVEGSLCTHENPPLIYWRPEPSQLAFHVRRFKMLRDYYPLVFDVSHWWLNVIDDFFDTFPEGKAIGLKRATRSCAESFMRIKGSGAQTLNHWARRGNAIWSESVWDYTYPNYDVAPDAKHNPDRAKLEMISRYVEEYNVAMDLRAAQRPERFVVARTEDLSRLDQQKRLFEFIGAPFTPFEGKLNEGNVSDGEQDEFIF